MNRADLQKNDLHGADCDLLRILALQSGDVRRIRRALNSGDAPSPSLVPHVISLLSVDRSAIDAMRSLREVAIRRRGALVDALLDVRLSPVVRRRLARVMTVCRTPDVVNALLQACDDEHRSVRVHSARTLFLLHRRHPDLPIDGSRVIALVQDELDGAADVGLVFTLLALVYPSAPVRAAYRSLRSANPRARGFAIEYLNGILPTDVAEKLAPVMSEMGRQR